MICCTCSVAVTGAACSTSALTLVRSSGLQYDPVASACSSRVTRTPTRSSAPTAGASSVDVVKSR